MGNEIWYGALAWQSSFSLATQDSIPRDPSPAAVQPRPRFNRQQWWPAESGPFLPPISILASSGARLQVRSCSIILLREVEVIRVPRL